MTQPEPPATPAPSGREHEPTRRCWCNGSFHNGQPPSADMRSGHTAMMPGTPAKRPGTGCPLTALGILAALLALAAARKATR